MSISAEGIGGGTEIVKGHQGRPGVDDGRGREEGVWAARGKCGRERVS